MRKLSKGLLLLGLNLLLTGAIVGSSIAIDQYYFKSKVIEPSSAAVYDKDNTKEETYVVLEHIGSNYSKEFLRELRKIEDYGIGYYVIDLSKYTNEELQDAGIVYDPQYRVISKQLVSTAICSQSKIDTAMADYSFYINNYKMNNKVEKLSDKTTYDLFKGDTFKIKNSSDEIVHSYEVKEEGRYTFYVQENELVAEKEERKDVFYAIAVNGIKKDFTFSYVENKIHSSIMELSSGDVVEIHKTNSHTLLDSTIVQKFTIPKNENEETITANYKFDIALTEKYNKKLLYSGYGSKTAKDLYNEITYIKEYGQPNNLSPSGDWLKTGSTYMALDVPIFEYDGENVSFTTNAYLYDSNSIRTYSTNSFYFQNEDELEVVEKEDENGNKYRTVQMVKYYPSEFNSAEAEGDDEVNTVQLELKGSIPVYDDLPLKSLIVTYKGDNGEIKFKVPVTYDE